MVAVALVLADHIDVGVERSTDLERLENSLFVVVRSKNLEGAERARFGTKIILITFSAVVTNGVGIGNWVESWIDGEADVLEIGNGLSVVADVVVRRSATTGIIFSGEESWWSADGLHMSEKGYDKMGELLAERIAKLLQPSQDS